MAMPAGRVTFCFTDVEGSTRLLARLGDDAYAQVLEAHRQVLRAAWRGHGGFEVRTEGDGSFVAFSHPTDALAACLEAQLGLQGLADVRVRMGVHTGDAMPTKDDYVGLTVHHAARVSAAANGGQIFVSEAAANAAGPLPEFVALTDLGTYRLRDVEGATRLFQLEHPDLVRDSRPPRAPSTAVHNLPIVRSAFVGRSDEMREVTKLLALHPLVTVTGTGGVGKTRLAIEAASASTGAFPDGAWLVELASIGDENLVASRVAGALGLTSSAEDTKAVIDYLRDRHVLLVIDNCEHVLGRVAELVDDALRACTGLTVLATSREPLRIRGEVTWRLPSLAEADAIRLFCDRAVLADPSFDPDESDVIAQISRRLDGIPLALELAAARLRTLSIGQLAETLDDRFSSLVSGFRTDLPRQQTLRATIDWSHDLLSEDERVLFRRMSVFRGGATIASIEEVCGDASALGSLIDRSLVVPADDRFTMLETILAYAGEQLDASGEAAEIVERHRRHYSRLMLGANVQDTKGLDLVGAEIDNLRAVLESAASDDVLELANKLAPYWIVRGPLAESIHWLRSALARDTRPTSARAVALRHLAGALGGIGRVEEAESAFDEALGWYREHGEESDLVDMQYQQGEMLLGVGETARATEIITRTLADARRLGNQDLEARCLYAMTYVASLGLRFDDVEEYSRAAFDIFVRLESTNHQATVIAIAGRGSMLKGDLVEARGRFAEALRLAESINDRSNVAYAEWLLGTVEASMGDLTAARTHLQEALEASPEVLPMHTCLIMATLAHLSLLEGDVAGALRGLDEALSAAENEDNELGMPYARMLRAGALLDAGRNEEAAADARAALRAYREIRDLGEMITSLVHLACATGDAGLIAAAGAEQARTGYVLEPHDSARVAKVFGTVAPASDLTFDDAVDRALRGSGER